MWPVGRGRGRGKNRLPTDGRHLGSFVVVGSRLQPTTGQGSNLVHQSSPGPGTLIYACQEQEKKAQGTQAHSRPNTRNDHSHNTTKKKQVLPLMFFFMTTNKKPVLPIMFFSWRPIKNDSVTPYIFFLTTNEKQQCYPLCFFSWRPIKKNSVTPNVFFHDDW